MVKTRASGKMLRSGVQTIRSMTTQAATKATAWRQLRPLGAVVLAGALVLVGLTLLGRVRVWMTLAGVGMIASSVLTAVHEFKHPQAAESYQDFLDKEMQKSGPKVLTVADISSVKTVSAKAKTSKAKAKAVAVAAPLNDASPAIISPSVEAESSVSSAGGRRKSADLGALEAATVVQKPRRNSSASSEASNTLNVMHCGTVIDIQGSHGFIIPHNLSSNARVKAAAPAAIASSAVSSSSAKPTMFQVKMPLVIPFDLPESEVAVRREISVGKTVEFAFSNNARAACALNVTPVPSDEEIEKSRTALRSCKQARQVSFARAMEGLTVISPRNVPVKHHVDLIKYAEQLEDDEMPFI